MLPYTSAHSTCAFPVYTVQAPGCFAGKLSKAGPVLLALPRSKLFRFRFLGTPQRHSLGWACVLCPSQVQAAQATRCLASSLSQVHSSLLVSWVHCKSAISGVPCVSSGELISGCDPPGRCQLSRIPGRLGYQLGACSQLGGGCHVWGHDCPLPSGSGFRPPPSLPLAG